MGTDDDDDGDYYVNGVLAISDHDTIASSNTADITALLHPGDNHIAFVARDNYLTYGYNHSKWAQIQSVPEPGSLAALGLGGLACLRQRRQK